MWEALRFLQFIKTKVNVAAAIIAVRIAKLGNSGMVGVVDWVAVGEGVSKVGFVDISSASTFIK
jgi:hypothetical protein